MRKEKPKKIESCNECNYIKPNEQHQQSGEAHWCKILNRRVYHDGRHPALKPLRECPFNQAISDYEQFLPSEEEIGKILIQVNKKEKLFDVALGGWFSYLAHAIWSRLNESR